jgi:hypothetical protein
LLVESHTVANQYRRNVQLQLVDQTSAQSVWYNAGPGDCHFFIVASAIAFVIADSMPFAQRIVRP